MPLQLPVLGGAGDGMVSWTTAALAGIEAISFVIYGVALGRYFRRGDRIDLRTAILSATGTAAAVLHFLCIVRMGTLDPGQAAAALLLYGAGLAVFFLAMSALGQRRLSVAFSPDAPQWLLDHGIYRVIRHPFYTAYTLSWLAGVVAAPSLATAAAAALMVAQYVAAAHGEEDKFARSPLATDYAAYRRRAGMFWPWLGSR